jgi:hypothetical protein
VRRRVDASLWYNLPGIVAAYQPIAAPSHIAARQNMGAGLLGKYTATPGTAPTWSPVSGWGFTAANSQYLATGIMPAETSSWSAFAQFAGVPQTGGGAYSVFGCQKSGGGAAYFYASPYFYTTQAGFGNGNESSVSGANLAAGNIGFAGRVRYINGIAQAGSLGTGGSPPVVLTLGCKNAGATRGEYLTGTLQAVLICSRPLSLAVSALVSLQMKYCAQPEFSVWARVRNYWFAPTGGFLPAWATGINTQIGMGTGANG